MRIAAISDVHGNLLALEAVLADIATQDVSLVVDLGDLLSGALWPYETAERLMALNLPGVRGNHERQLLTSPPEHMGLSDRFAHETLSHEHRQWLASLPLTLDLADGVLAFHGTPTDDLTYLLETVDADGARPATVDEVTALLGAQAQKQLLLCGHTHLQRSMHLPSGALVVNPGSVGWPAYADDAPYPHVIEAGTPHARYAICTDDSGTWRVTFLAVDYDWEHAAHRAETNGRPDVAHALRTGRTPPRA